MVRSMIVFVVMVLCVYVSLADNDYCRIVSCGKQPHIACVFTSTRLSSDCKRIIKSGLTYEEKKKIVDLHNEYRQKVASGKETRGSPGPQPPAKNMTYVEWDDELAIIAQKWADQCTWGHDTCRDVQRFKVGQNIAYIATTGDVNTLKVEELVKMWYDEVDHMNKNNVSSFNNRGTNGKAIGHYTQLVWAKSTKIGCGAVKYNDGRFNRFHLVCNYGPTGNFLGEPIYEINYPRRNLKNNMKMITSTTIFIVLMTALTTLSTASNYCHIRCRYGNSWTDYNSHTTCLYSRPGPSAYCTGYQGSGLSNDEKHRIIDLHNRLRHKVASGQETQGMPGPQPRAKYMPYLEWDDEIASIAQRWADQCTWGHDSCRDIDRYPIGQNIGLRFTTGDLSSINVESIVQDWYNEVKNFNRNQVSRFINKGAGGNMIGHYTQLVWAKTTKIGCGVSKYKNGYANLFYLVCNYGPSGNYLSEPVYQTA
ncbi:uncharacterized protein LOC131670725 [Phymastichus coffea]|uniref:uncharacterized protein LOC131670725 n=1 Tax=Phymastichus coffea TaxID=108790 RepID=UPI00273CCE50|nr:uncharacterized protein LOC131670725 [Phymastichus coffea]